MTRFHGNIGCIGALMFLCPFQAGNVSFAPEVVVSSDEHHSPHLFSAQPQGIGGVDICYDIPLHLESRCEHTIFNAKRFQH
jgi:hypothetical protein